MIVNCKGGKDATTSYRELLTTDKDVQDIRKRSSRSSMKSHFDLEEW